VHERRRVCVRVFLLIPMPRAGTILSPSSLASPYFRHYLINGAIFGNKVCVLIFSTTFI
jgi:hypothetical protein